MKKIALIGSQEFAAQLAHLASTCGHMVSGYFDDFKPIGTDEGKLILGPIDSVVAFHHSRMMAAVMIGIGYKHLMYRAQIFGKLQGHGIPFARLIHPHAFVDPSAFIEAGSALYAGCVIDKGARVAANVLLNLGCIVSHDSEIGAHSFIAPGATIAGFAKIGERCFIGANATVIDEIRIANDTFIGAGAVVTRSIIEPGIYVGNPARRIR
jgi:sugar O-acyltransferase (sialic acid O-acetyltransferase NeuD family)